MKRCHACGFIVKKDLSERRHICACGTDCGRDENAAKTLLRWLLEGNFWLGTSQGAAPKGTSYGRNASRNPFHSVKRLVRIVHSTPETTDRAFAALVAIEGLRAEVADDRGQSTQSKTLFEASKALDVVLRQKMPELSVTAPRYRILVGADRLFVMSPKTIKNLPSEINGVPIEPLTDGLIATAH